MSTESQGNERRAFGHHVRQARLHRGWTQSELAARCGWTQSDISKIESGVRHPTLGQLIALARALGVALQWLLTGRNRPGLELAGIALELRDLGVVDLLVPGVRVPGAFRPPEQIVAYAIRGDAPDPRVVEALPAVFAWNTWDHRLLAAYARRADRRGPARLAWLVDIALTIQRGQGFPGGIVDAHSLSALTARIKPAIRPDTLGRPGLHLKRLPPVHRRWNIQYATDLAGFVERAGRLHALTQGEADAGPNRRMEAGA